MNFVCKFYIKLLIKITLNVPNITMSSWSRLYYTSHTWIQGVQAYMDSRSSSRLRTQWIHSANLIANNFHGGIVPRKILAYVQNACLPIMNIINWERDYPNGWGLWPLGVHRALYNSLGQEDLFRKGLQLPTDDDFLDVEMGTEDDSSTQPHQESIIGCLSC